jgi:hypothetical protein
LQWQWHGNPVPEWMFLSGSEGFMRLYCQYNSQEDVNLWDIPHLYMQKFPAPEFTATARVSFEPKQDGDRMGLLVMGLSYSALVLEHKEGKVYYSVLQNPDAENGGKHLKDPGIPAPSGELYLRVSVKENALCAFSISTDGENFTETGASFEASEGKWIGAKVGLYALGSKRTNDTGWVDVDWFRITK